MSKQRTITEYSKNGLPYACTGNGTQILVVFGGLEFNHNPPSGMSLRSSIGFLSDLTNQYRIYAVNRKPHLPKGYSIRDMSDDYAAMIKDELHSPVDIIGISTGGTIALQMALDHPGSVRRLVLAMTGCRLTPEARVQQMRVAELARKGRRRAAYALMGSVLAPKGFLKYFLKWFMWVMAPALIPADPADGIAEIEAEDSFDLSNSLHRIQAKTLVIGGEHDFFYDLRETAVKIPDSRLVLFPGLGHNAMFVRSRQFGREIKEFLLE